MGVHSNIIKSNAEHTRIYENMRGIDTRPDAKPEKSFLYTENMYVDYGGSADAVESIPGFRRICSLGERINLITSHKLGESEEYLIVHAGTSLYRFNVKDRDSLGQLTPIATLENTKSFATYYGGDLYILDGKSILKIDPEGNVADFFLGEIDPYLPTTFINGKEYEEVNLLSDSFIERYYVDEPYRLSHSTDGLLFRIIDLDLGTCGVYGAKEELSGSVYIPHTATINGVEFRVTEVMRAAFSQNKTITELICNYGLELIGDFAFYDSAIERVILSPTVKSIGSYAFYLANSLKELYLGAGFEQYGGGMFMQNTADVKIYYALDSRQYDNVVGTEAAEGKTVIYNSPYNKISVDIPLYTPAINIESVSTVKEELPFTFSGGSYVTLVLETPDPIINRELTIRGLVDRSSPLVAGFPSTLQARRVDAESAILGSRVAAEFDGRLFLSGHPELGGTVFYNSYTGNGELHPLYYGSKSYFCDGLGGYPVSALMVSEDSLSVMRCGNDGWGTVNYHAVSGEGVKRSYPVSYVHHGIRSAGEARSFLGETLMICSEGLVSVRRSSAEVRKLESRSAKIGAILRKEPLYTLKMTEWEGYLVIHSGSTLYLADPEKRFSEGYSGSFDWYIVKGVGSYENATRVYRYSDISNDTYKLHPTPGERVFGKVYGISFPTPGIYYYTVEDGVKYAVRPSEEYEGGDFSPASAVHGMGSLLFFGTESGNLLVFNNDKRGVAPERLKAQSDFDEQLYASVMKDRIHPDFYNFDGHSVRYSVTTVPDNCGIPELLKSTVASSPVFKLKAFDGGRLNCEIGDPVSGFRRLTGISTSRFSFPDLTFTEASFGVAEHTFLPIVDRSGGWVEQRFSLYTDEFCSPFGIYSLSYRYRIKGRIKRRTE